MEKLKERYHLMIKMLFILKEVIDLKEKYDQDSPLYKPLRDSTIQRFEYSFDAFWKLLKLYLQEKQNVVFDEISPRLVFRVSADAKLISAEEYAVLLKAIADCNQTSHSYNERVAEDITENISEYYLVMQQVVDRIV